MLEGYGPTAILLAIGVILLIGELLLPTGGMLGVIGVGAALAAIVAAGMRNAWAAAFLTLALALATPLFWTLAIKLWPRTFVGRRMMLPPVDNTPPPAPVTVGQTGVAVSELRPMGICEFDTGGPAGQTGGRVRVEAHSEHGIVEPGKTVRVVALVNNRPTVRVVG
jgi:membrane-bound serine protease (ClpP class)